MNTTFGQLRRQTAIAIVMLGCCLPLPDLAQAQAVPNSGSDGPSEPPEVHYAPRPDDALEDAIHAAARDARKRPPAVKVVIPEMAILYRELAFAESLPRYKREELQTKLEYYLIELGLFVIDDFHRQERKRPYSERSLGQKLSGNSRKNGSEGGAARANAQDLIDLITSTIAPETWDINGGIGSIHYYSLTPALVVRQTGTTQADVNRLMNGLR